MKRTIMIAGREVSPEQAMRFEIVRGVLMGAISVVQGANILHVSMLELSRIVNGARLAIIRAYGEEALTRVGESYAIDGRH